MHVFRTRAWLVGVAAWALLGAALFGVAYGLDGHQRRLYTALQLSEMTTGTLVSKDTANHDSFTYSYVDQHDHQHTGGGDGEGQEQGDPADLPVGTAITVWYSLRDPAVSCYCTPADNTPAGLIGPELLISQFLAVPVGALIGVVVWRRRNGLRPWRIGRRGA